MPNQRLWGGDRGGIRGLNRRFRGSPWGLRRIRIECGRSALVPTTEPECGPVTNPDSIPTQFPLCPSQGLRRPEAPLQVLMKTLEYPARRLILNRPKSRQDVAGAPRQERAAQAHHSFPIHRRTSCGSTGIQHRQGQVRCMPINLSCANDPVTGKNAHRAQDSMCTGIGLDQVRGQMQGPSIVQGIDQCTLGESRARQESLTTT